VLLVLIVAPFSLVVKSFGLCNYLLDLTIAEITLTFVMLILLSRTWRLSHNGLVKRQIQKHTAMFLYQGKQIPFDFWAQPDDKGSVDTIVFLGTGQTGKLPRWAAESALPGTVVVAGAPHWIADPSGSDLYEFAYDYTLTAFKAVETEFKLKSAHIIGESQAVPGVVRLGLGESQLVGNVALVAPLGFTATILGDTPEARLRELKKRAKRTLMQPALSPLIDWRVAYAAYSIMRGVRAETVKGASDRKYATGLSYDLTGDFRELVDIQTYKHARVVLILGQDDLVIPASEVVGSLEKAGIRDVPTVVLPGAAHASLGVRAGKATLVRAIQEVRAVTG
jgi:hypothetical protein